MPRQPGKGSHHKRREAAFERKAMQHTDFVGGADAERAEAELRKHERVEAERKDDAVHEMAAELEQFAGLKKDGAPSAELPFRIPRSIDDVRQMLSEAPDALREKARERLEQLPEPAQRLVQMAQDAAGLLFAPVRLGYGLARELMRVPMSLLRILRHREA